MWLLFGLKDKLVEKSKAKNRNEKDAHKNICETVLNEVEEKERQEVLRDLGKDDLLKIDQKLTGRKVEFEVFTSDEKSIGIIPSEVYEELEAAMKEDLKTEITRYRVTKDENGLFNCNITIVVKVV